MFNNLIAVSATQWIMIALLAVMVVVLIVLPMFTNKRRNKAVTELHSSLRPGDVIKTVGGIVGTITAIEELSPVDKQMVVETGTGDNKSTMLFDVQAVYQVISKTSAPLPEQVVPEPAPEAEQAAAEPSEAAEAESQSAAVDASEPEQTDAEQPAAPAEAVAPKKREAKTAGSSKK